MGLGGFGGAGPEGPPNVTEGAGQAPPPTGCLRPYSSYLYLPTEGLNLITAPVLCVWHRAQGGSGARARATARSFLSWNK